LDKDVQYWLPIPAALGIESTATANEDANSGIGSETMPPPPAACAAGSTTPHLCLNVSRWAEINAFCMATGLSLVFGLSLNMTQNEQIIRYSHKQNYSIVAYEIPEEYTPSWHNYPGSDGNFTEYIGWYVSLFWADASNSC
jgi:hypothetical protein